jgi:hypothetical protein
MRVCDNVGMLRQPSKAWRLPLAKLAVVGVPPGVLDLTIRRPGRDKDS